MAIMKVGVMASGRGSNFQAIIDAGLRGETPDVEISQLIVNKPEAYAIEIAKKNSIPYEIVDSVTYQYVWSVFQLILKVLGFSILLIQVDKILQVYY